MTLNDFMTKTQNLFFSCVDSQIQGQGSMYARFHLGTFFSGQSLTFANALRRVILSEIPGIIIKHVEIEGASHEFGTIPGVQETVLDILLNLKKLVFTPVTKNLTELNDFQTEVFLNAAGPRKITAADIKLPSTVKCINPNASIATLTTDSKFSLRLELEFVDPNKSKISKKATPSNDKKDFLSPTQIRKFSLDTLPMPVQKVNYVIKELDAKSGSEYLILEIWTDGSLTPQDILQFALKNLTQLFYQFAEFSKQQIIPSKN